MIPESRAVQERPSGEVSTLPPKPTATNWFPAQTTAARLSVAGVGTLVQVTPSADRRTEVVPYIVATIPLEDPATPTSWFPVPELRAAHAVPSGEARIVPPTPTARNSVPVQVTSDSMSLVTPESRTVMARTSTRVCPWIPSEATVTSVVPVPTAVTSPAAPGPVVVVATAGAEEAHWATSVRSTSGPEWQATPVARN